MDTEYLSDFKNGYISAKLLEELIKPIIDGKYDYLQDSYMDRYIIQYFGSEHALINFSFGKIIRNMQEVIEFKYKSNTKRLFFFDYTEYGQISKWKFIDEIEENLYQTEYSNRIKYCFGYTKGIAKLKTELKSQIHFCEILLNFIIKKASEININKITTAEFILELHTAVENYIIKDEQHLMARNVKLSN